MLYYNLKNLSALKVNQILIETHAKTARFERKGLSNAPVVYDNDGSDTLITYGFD